MQILIRLHRLKNIKGQNITQIYSVAKNFPDNHVEAHEAHARYLHVVV